MPFKIQVIDTDQAPEHNLMHQLSNSDDNPAIYYHTNDHGLLPRFEQAFKECKYTDNTSALVTIGNAAIFSLLAIAPVWLGNIVILDIQPEVIEYLEETYNAINSSNSKEELQANLLQGKHAANFKSEIGFLGDAHFIHHFDIIKERISQINFTCYQADLLSKQQMHNVYQALKLAGLNVSLLNLCIPFETNSNSSLKANSNSGNIRTHLLVYPNSHVSQMNCIIC